MNAEIDCRCRTLLGILPKDLSERWSDSKDLFLFAFFENGNVLCEQIEMGKNLPEIHTLLQSRREEISADMPRDHGLPVHKCLNH